ncbi:MAG: hypothetical protein A2Y75_01215 [Candidatus Solincola sediminis]|uniref:IPT/TIG domain-containing protein n=1 Tax=Candidatus Solincola sediminis TaxID=1797199 RepID=A0A1F2WS24_9ACTN|nr:MAG: hypothetical protein A2Y75_01215 [Candidatus Solincola sediminis]
MTVKKAIALFLTLALVVLMGLAMFGCGKSQTKPEIKSLEPVSGPVGTEVIMTGTGFGAEQGTGTVHFGNFLADVLAWSDTSITVEVPSSIAVAEYGVTVQTQAGSSNEIPFTVNQTPNPGTKPTISSLKPTSGQPGTDVVISGTKFGATQGSSLVLFGQGKAQVIAWSDTSITFRVSQETTNNTYGVTVETANGKSGQAIFKVHRPEDLAAQKKAIVDYMGSNGMDIRGSEQWTVEFMKQSLKDAAWEVIKVNQPNDNTFQALLILNQMAGAWECLSTEGPPWNGVDFKGEPVPSDLKNV